MHPSDIHLILKQLLILKISHFCEDTIDARFFKVVFNFVKATVHKKGLFLIEQL